MGRTPHEEGEPRGGGTGISARLYFGMNRHLYARWPRGFDLLAHLLTLGRFGRWRRSALVHLEGDRILEIGHGTGALLLHLSRAGKRPVGLEISPAMQRATGRRLARAGVRVPCVVGDATALPFRDGAFDSIVSTFPTSYASALPVLCCLRRLLPSSAEGGASGRLVLVGVCIDSDHALLRPLLRRVFGPTHTRLASFTEPLVEAGFTVGVHRSEGAFLRTVTLVGRPR